MALYDTYNSPEDLLRPDRVGIAPQIASPQPFAATASDTTSELSPAFIGGSVDPATRNLVPGTKQEVMRGATPTPFMPPAPQKPKPSNPIPKPSTPVPPPAKPPKPPLTPAVPSSRLADVSPTPAPAPWYTTIR